MFMFPGRDTWQMSICIILGTRPEIVKMSPIVRECVRRGIDHYVIHTGQHYSYEMDRIFFEELELGEARYNLNVGSGPHGQQTGKMLAGIESILVKDRPRAVLVQGDTNTVLAGALAASKMSIPIGHVEAGLRSFDRTMPEEINRVIADHVSDMLFATSLTSRANLLAEGINEKKIFVTGNTIVDAVKQNLEISKRKVCGLFNTLHLEKGSYILATLHRQENVDSKERLEGIMQGLQETGSALGYVVILPMHPRTRKNMATFGLATPPGIRIIDPLGFLEFLQLESNAHLALTDSGGVQEESCILGVPCVTLRNNTERPETVDVGANVVAGVESANIVKCAKHMSDRQRKWECPLGDGHAAKHMIDIIMEGTN
jgi:UDP-N-acetylglucosamine 2-epimerase (non-hydrolysing)